jgi:hypothetical protein
VRDGDAVAVASASDRRAIRPVDFFWVLRQVGGAETHAAGAGAEDLGHAKWSLRLGVESLFA